MTSVVAECLVTTAQDTSYDPGDTAAGRQPIRTFLQKVKTENCEVATAKTTPHTRAAAAAQPPKNTTTQPQQTIIIIIIACIIAWDISRAIK